MIKAMRTWYETMVKPLSLDEVIQREMERATLEATQARHVITSHRFQEHMARARIEALEDWNHSRNIRCRPDQP